MIIENLSLNLINYNFIYILSEFKAQITYANFGTLFFCTSWTFKKLDASIAIAALAIFPLLPTHGLVGGINTPLP